MAITVVSVYQLSVFVQGKDPLTAFSDHLGEIRFYLSNLKQSLLFYISHISLVPCSKSTQKPLPTQSLWRL